MLLFISYPMISDGALDLPADLGQPAHILTTGHPLFAVAFGKARNTLGKGFAECSTRQKINRQRRLCRVLFVGHSAKSLPSVGKALGKDLHSAK